MPAKLLIVDDDREFRGEFKEVLEDYEVVEASDGNEALRLLKKANDIDLVLLDVMMPGLSGIEVLNKIKDTDPGLAIIILTGQSSKNIAIEALKGHADDYLEKPLDIKKTREVIEGILETRYGGLEGGGLKGKIEKIKYFIERNCYKKICLGDAARTIYLSPKYLSRIFKESTGLTFSGYKLKIKIGKSKELLSQTGYNINEISYKLGYENAESFIRQFKKLTGLSPTQYRRQVKVTPKSKGKKIPKKLLS